MDKNSPIKKDVTQSARVCTGVPGLDDILGGGLTKNRVYLLEGSPGTGKTTLALQFLMEGVSIGEKSLYITLSESVEEINEIAGSHGWDIGGITMFELINDAGLDPDSEQSIFHPSEVELGETTKSIMGEVDRVMPSRVVFDSLSELRLLAQNPLRYRRQILAIKNYFSTRKCTVILLDDKTSEAGDQQLHSIAHGVIVLEQLAQEFGKERRRLNIVKMRGIKFRGGYHDFILDTGGLIVFPRLIAAEHGADFTPSSQSTGAAGLDELLGGGLVSGTSTLFLGPSGIGKTTLAIRTILAALQRGESAALYLFDEGLGTLLVRSAALGMDVRPYMENGKLVIHHIDPAELAPGQFAHMLRDAVEKQSVSFIAIDSLNAYLQSMPGEKHLILQMHELLSYLNNQGVTTVLVLGQHGMIGEMRSHIDVSYLADATVLLRFFETNGRLHRAITAIKSRTNAHEQSIRELQFNKDGVVVGKELEGFEGILTGVPHYRGETQMMVAPDGVNDQ
ncbi:ATPase domain-containing protein [Oxalobacteraceae bacterium R-40]|uniref:non-specific serine/threonine protein kinase n=1 Tax=Keguizhuia sedimenti TaxID=3064264 RepID=A0ABU1BLC4_9BURK|nr:ATPase domain-containing protein [Oxalobacteraceae bacterium R-40]